MSSLVEEFLEGNRRKYTATFKVPNETGNLTDPNPVTFYRRKLGSGPANPETYVYGASAVARQSLGIYTLELSYSENGRYVIGAQGEGPCEAYVEMNAVVENAKARA